jgi:hypothetical protein
MKFYLRFQKTLNLQQINNNFFPSLNTEYELKL